MRNEVLRRDSDCDYTLKKKYDFVWVTVGNISVYIRRNDEGVSVDLFPLGKEANESLAGTWATYDEGNEDE